MLAVLPSHGSRVAPYRMVMLLSLSTTSYKIHDWLRQMDAKTDHELAETEILPLCFPLVFSLQKLGLVVMLPLKTISDFCAKLRTFGQENLVAELLAEGVKKGGAGAEAMLLAQQRAELLGKLKDEQAAAQDMDACARTLVRTFNLAFLPFGVALIALGSKAADSEWKDFLSSEVIACIIAVGVLLLLTACLGFCGAQSRSRCMLVLYAAILFCVMVLQLAAAGVAHDLNAQMQAALDGSLGEGTYNETSRVYSSYANDALNALRRETEGVYTKSQCAFASPYAPLRIRCERNAWFESFANSKCTYFNVTDVDFLSGRVTSAIATKRWSTANLQYSRLKSVSSIATGISECNRKYNVAGFGSPGGLFCTCRSALVEKLNSFVMPAANMLIVLAFLELIVLINCITIVRAAKRVVQASVSIKRASAVGEGNGGSPVDK